MPTDPYSTTLNWLSSKRNVLLATHVKPDGDALGSVTAMSLTLRKKGIQSRTLLFNPLPEKYASLFESNALSYFNVEKGWPADVDVNSFDAIVILDTGTWSQLPGLSDYLKPFRGPKLVIDHHLTQEDWADVKLVEPEAAAAGEIVAELMDAWGVAMDLSIATSLFVAIATDTGWFQFSNTRPATMRLAARLMEAGVNTDHLYRMAFQNERPQRLVLTSRAIQSLELLAGNRLAVMSLSKDDFQQTSADGSDTENLINFPMQVGSVEVSVLAIQPPEGGAIRVSLRSKGAIDVAAFAHRFSGGKGGGHARAAGMKMDGDLAAVRASVVKALIAALSGI
jgi:phosphoesterase RecJ-like protein